MARQRIVRNPIRRDAGEVKRYRTWMRVLPTLIGVLTLILIIAYVISVLYMKYGAFTVAVSKLDNLDYKLTLSDSQSFETKTSRLNAEISKIVTNIDGATLPDYLDNIDGEHNGENYVAYTFYCKNLGSETVNYTHELYIANMTKGIEEAARILFYVNGEPTLYAYPRTDGTDGPEPGTEPFMSTTTITKNEVRNFKPNDVTKYTVVIYLEGNDPQCVDKILGGEFKVDMAINVLNPGGDEPSAQEIMREDIDLRPWIIAAVILLLLIVLSLIWYRIRKKKKVTFEK